MALVRCAIALAIFVYLFDQISPTTVLDHASAAAPGALLAAFLVALLAHVVIADRLRRLVEAFGMEMSILNLLQINLATVFYGLILPAGNVTARRITPASRWPWRSSAWSRRSPSAWSGSRSGWQTRPRIGRPCC